MANQTVKVIFDGQDKTRASVNSLRGNLDNANKAIDKVKSSLGGMKSAIGLAAGAAGFGLLAKRALETADNLAKTSSRLGIAAKDMNALQLAANYAGVETNTFNKLMEIFQKRVGEAAEGTGQAKEILDKFGISAEKLANLPLDKQLGIISDEFKKLKTPAERAAAAADLFSNRGIRLINFLDNGSDGLADLREEFRRLGLEIDDKSLRSIENFNDSMTKVQGIIDAALIKGLGEAAPQMEAVAQRFAEMAVPLTGALLDGLMFLLDNLQTITNLFAGLLAVMVVTKVVNFALAIVELVRVLGTLRIAAIATQAALGPIGIAMAAISAGAVLFSSEIAEAGEKVADMVNPTDEASKSTNELETSLRDLRDEAEQVDAPITELGDDIEETGQKTEVTTNQTDKYREALEKLRKEIAAPKQAIIDFKAQIDLLNDQMDRGEISAEDYARAIGLLTGKLTGVGDELQDNRDKQEALNAAIDAAIRSGGQNAAQLELLRTKLEELKKAEEVLILRSGGLSQAQIDLMNKIKGVGSATDEYLNTVRDLDNLLANGKITLDEYNRAIEGLNAELSGIQNPTAVFAEKISELEKTIGALEQNTTGTSGALGVMKDRLEKAKAAADRLAGPEGQQMIKDYYEAIARGTDPGEALEQLEEKLSKSRSLSDMLFGSAMQNKIRDFFNAIGAGVAGEGTITLLQGALGELENAFSEFFVSGEFKFRDFVDNIIDGLKRIAAEAIVSVGLNFVKSIIPGLADGGQVPGFADGGRVFGPGGPREDRVPAMLSPGEFVINAGSVSKFGVGFFNALNDGKLPGFAMGGSVSITSGSDINWIFEILDQLFMNLTRYRVDKEYLSPEDRYNAYYMSSLQYLYDWILRSTMAATNKSAVNVGANFDDYRGDYVTDIAGGIASKILPGIGLEKAAELIEAFKVNSLTDALFNGLFPNMRDLSLNMGNFNLDKEFARMYMASSNIVNREFGGPLERNQPAIVGENGPELFIPGRSGTVAPIKGGESDLIEAVLEVRDEISDLRRQFGRALSGGQLAGGRG